MIEKGMDFFSVPQEIDWMLSLAAGDLQTPLMEGMDWQRFAAYGASQRPVLRSKTAEMRS